MLSDVQRVSGEIFLEISLLREGRQYHLWKEDLAASGVTSVDLGHITLAPHGIISLLINRAWRVCPYANKTLGYFKPT